MPTTPNADAMVERARVELERRRTIEARLDRLRKRAETHPVSTLKGVIDLLADVLLEDNHGQ